MAGVTFKDRVKDSSTTTGTGNLTLSGTAPTGYQDFNTAFSTSIQFYYCIEGGAEWEVGEGHLSAATTLVRDTIFASTNSNNAVNFSAGTKNVFATIPAVGVQQRIVETSGASFNAGAVRNADYLYFLSGAHVPTLPTAVGNTNQYTFKNNHTARIAFTTTSSQTVDGLASTVFVIFPGEELVMYSDGANWITNKFSDWRTAGKAATETRTTTTVTAADATLHFPVLANATYELDFFISFGVFTAPDFKYKFSVPSSTSLAVTRHVMVDATITQAQAPTLTADIAILNGTGGHQSMRINGVFICGVTGGTFSFDWAQNTSDATGATVLGGSFLRFRRVV